MGLRKAQLGVEFFLILSVIIAFAIILYNVGVSEGGQAKALDAVVSAKNTLDYLSSSANYVLLSGNASVLKNALYFPKDARCIYFDETNRTFFCVMSSEFLSRMSDKRLVLSNPVIGSANVSVTCAPPLNPGWYEVEVNNTNNTIFISCVSR